MMTTVAALFGTLPIALGYGEGGDARQPLGLAVVGGPGGFAVPDAVHYAGDLPLHGTAAAGARRQQSDGGYGRAAGLIAGLGRSFSRAPGTWRRIRT